MPPQGCTLSETGYKIVLNQPVELSVTPTIRSSYASPKKQKFLLDCVQEMLQKMPLPQ